MRWLKVPSVQVGPWAGFIDVCGWKQVCKVRSVGCRLPVRSADLAALCKEESSILFWRGALGLHEPQSQAAWGWAAGWDGALRLPECGPEVPAGAHGPGRGSISMTQAGVSLHTF